MSIEDEPVRTANFNYLEYVKLAVESGLFDSMAHIHLGWQALPPGPMEPTLAGW